MSYINNASDFTIPNGIQEMSFDEIDQVEGGIVLELIFVCGIL